MTTARDTTGPPAGADEAAVLAELADALRRVRKGAPLPRINSRFGHPTPQNGVEVERKWSRPDYRVPGTNFLRVRSTL